VGKFATPQRSAYAASKHALHGYFDALRAEVAGRGVGVTMLCPGFIRTDVTRNALTADGTPQGTMDAAQARGMDPATCARQMADALAAGRAEVYIGGRETWGVYLHRLWPALFRRLIRRVPVT
jgi:short-subunit dehydrogenase